MDQLVTVRDMKQRYSCSSPTARKYLRQVFPHMENPLAAPLWAVMEWEASRTVLPASISRVRYIARNTGRVFVPRTREG